MFGKSLWLLPGRRARLALLLVSVAPLSVACAHALDTPSPDAFDQQSDAGATAGASSSAGSDAEGGSSSAGLGNSSRAPSLPQAGSDNGSEAGGPGQPAAGAAGRAEGGNSAGGAGGRAAGGSNAGSASGGSSAGAAGSLAAAGAGSHVCKVTADLNAYTPSKAGCGGYTTCKGQIHWRNDETHALSQMVLSFPEPAGVACTSDNATSKWTITDNGATSHRCVFTAIASALTVDSQSALSFGYDTTQTDTTAPCGLSVSDPSCN
jgi:hypothetical protein